MSKARASIFRHPGEGRDLTLASPCNVEIPAFAGMRSEEHTSELQSLMRISYAVFCLKKKKKKKLSVHSYNASTAQYIYNDIVENKSSIVDVFNAYQKADVYTLYI